MKKRTRKKPEIPGGHKVGDSVWSVQSSALDPPHPRLMFVRREITSAGPRQIVTEGLGGRQTHGLQPVLGGTEHRWYPLLITTKAEARERFLHSALSELAATRRRMDDLAEKISAVDGLDPTPEPYDDWSPSRNSGRMSPTARARALIRKYGESAWCVATRYMAEAQTEDNQPLAGYQLRVRGEIARLTEPAE